MGHSYGLLTAWDIRMVYYLHGTFLWFINCMGHSYGLLTAWRQYYGLLTAWGNPMVY